jgi:hypothetical protein
MDAHRQMSAFFSPASGLDPATDHVLAELDARERRERR